MLSVLYRSYQTFTCSIVEFLMSILDSHVRQIYDSISHKRCQLFKGSLTLDLYFAKEIPKTNMYTFKVINWLPFRARNLDTSTTQRQTRSSTIRTISFKAFRWTMKIIGKNENEVKLLNFSLGLQF